MIRSRESSGFWKNGRGIILSVFSHRCLGFSKGICHAKKLLQLYPQFCLWDPARLILCDCGTEGQLNENVMSCCENYAVL